MHWFALLAPALLTAQIVELGPAPRAPEPLPGVKTEERAATVERGAWYDTSNRETVRQAYLNTFTSVSMGWTGAIAGCVPGTTALAWRNSAAARINWFRSMAGVPDGITLNDTYNTKDQQAALMMSANRSLSHTPGTGWPCYTADGAEAAGDSNLCYSWNSTPEPGCVSQYIEDSGANNYFVGHRRWILHPQTQQMGTGDVNQTGSFPSGYPYANALWVFDGHTFDTRPATRDGYVAWPPKGYVPYQKVYARWSFGYPGANFAGATVTMNGSSSGVTKETLRNDEGYGENTIVWTWSGQPSGVPSSDTTVTVTISGITGAPQSSYTYQVIIFDPATTGGGGTTAVTVTTNPAGRTFTVDGTTYSSAQVFNWTPGSQHTIATTSPQSAAGTQYTFSNWSDSGAISHSVTTPASSTTYTANFTTQYQLTTAVSPPGSGTVTPSGGYFDAGSTVQMSASATNFLNWSGDLSGTTNPQNLVMNGPRSVTANYSGGTTAVTVTTNPVGRTFTVDGVGYASTQVFHWTPGSQHTIATTSPQTAGGTRSTYTGWSDGGAISHTITTPASATTYTASFSLQYLLTTAVSPVGAGTVTANPSSGDGYYNAGASVQLTAATPQFANWSGDLSGTTNPQNVVMNGPRSVTANYTATNTITVTSNPVGRSIVVDGTTYTAPQAFNWTQGSQHTIGTSSPQGAGGTRYVFASWSDAGAISHSVTAPGTATTYTANFTTQYLLTRTVSPVGAGTVTASPASGDGYYIAGAAVQLTASAAQFLNWSGDLTGTANPQTVTMNAPRSVTANYGGGQACVFTTPLSTYNVSAPANTGSFTVTANCAFTPVTQTGWIHVLSGTNENPVRYSVDRNTGGARVGTITIGTTTVTIVQDAVAAVSAALRFVSLEPCRLMETRAEYNYQGRTGAFGPPFMQAGETRTLTPSLSNVCTVPADAKAYVLNVTLVPRGGVDHITVWPAGQSKPNFWTVRSPDGQIVANAAIVAAGTGGGIQVYASNDADLIIDIAGYFTDSAAASNLVFYPLTPCRVIDTRIDYRQPAGPFGPPSMTAQTKRTFQFPAATTYCSIPANARAFSVSLTAVPKGALQFITIWPAGGSQPNVSSINSPSGRIVANSVIVPASANGSIDVYAFNDTDFLIDINGYFAPDDGQNGLFFYTAPQCRVNDTTGTDGPAYGTDATRTIGVAASDKCVNVPATAKAFALNFTAIPNGSPMPFLTAYPTGQGQPNASVLNAFEGQTVTNSAIIPSGPNGQVNVYAYRPTHVVVELSGYFGR